MRYVQVKAEKTEICPAIMAAYYIKLSTNNMLNRKDGYAAQSVIEIYENTDSANGRQVLPYNMRNSR